MSVVEMLRAAERNEGVHQYEPIDLPRLLRDQVVEVLLCEAEPHVTADAIGICVQAAQTFGGLPPRSGSIGPDRPMLEIPIAAARAIAASYGYDQVVVIGRRVGAEPEPYGEHVTTDGVDATHSAVAARAGRAIQRFMQWPLTKDDPVVKALGAAVMALRSYQHGNSATHLAAEIADAGEEALRAVGCPLDMAATS